MENNYNILVIAFRILYDLFTSVYPFYLTPLFFILCCYIILKEEKSLMLGGTFRLLLVSIICGHLLIICIPFIVLWILFYFIGIINQKFAKKRIFKTQDYKKIEYEIAELTKEFKDGKIRYISKYEQRTAQFIESFEYKYSGYYYISVINEIFYLGINYSQALIEARKLSKWLKSTDY